MELKDYSVQVIGAAIRVQKALGPGFLESIYEEALKLELHNARVDYKNQLHVPIFYLGKEIGSHRVDLLVQNQLVVELKAIKEFEDIHFSQVRSYLKALGLKHGLLINFAKVPLGIKRVIFEKK